MEPVNNVPAAVRDQYEKYRVKALTFRTMSRRQYDQMINQFKKYGLYQPKSRMGVIFPSDISKDEYRQRQRAYMKQWRASHPGYNLVHIQKFKAKKSV